jgi:hypothetical protein
LIFISKEKDKTKHKYGVEQILSSSRVEEVVKILIIIYVKFHGPGLFTAA